MWLLLRETKLVNAIGRENSKGKEGCFLPFLLPEQDFAFRPHLMERMVSGDERVSEDESQ